jgi:type VI secretion system secreted protein Hcp
MAVDFYLKIDSIDGESQDSKHKNEIEILSWSWGATNRGTAATGGGMGQGKVAMRDIFFVKGIDKASAKLMLACASGQHIKSAVLVCRKAGKEQQEYLKLTFSDVLVSSYQQGPGSQPSGTQRAGGEISFGEFPIPKHLASSSPGLFVAACAGSGVPNETFSLNFSKIEYGYKEQKADGTLGGAIQHHWSVKDNKGG